MKQVGATQISHVSAPWWLWHICSQGHRHFTYDNWPHYEAYQGISTCAQMYLSQVPPSHPSVTVPNVPWSLASTPSWTYLLSLFSLLPLLPLPSSTYFGRFLLTSFSKALSSTILDRRPLHPGILQLRALSSCAHLTSPSYPFSLLYLNQWSDPDTAVYQRLPVANRYQTLKNIECINKIFSTM